VPGLSPFACAAARVGLFRLPATGRARAVRAGTYRRAVRLIVARCEVTYAGRLNAVLPESMRLLMLKADGSVLVHADAGGYKPLNWMTPPTIIEEHGQPLERIVVRKHASRNEERLEIRVLELVSELQAELADRPHALGEALRLVRREWPTDVGPVDLMCRDELGGWVAIEVKRIGTIDAVEQLGRYLERIRLDPARADCRGILAAVRVRPQALTLAEARGIRCAEVDLEVLRGAREPELTLFAP
jgi:endonuclease